MKRYIFILIVSLLMIAGRAGATGCTISGPVATTTVCAGVTVNLNVIPGGGTIPYSYQWYSNTTNSNSGGTSLGAGNGAQTDTYTPPTSSAGTFYYYCSVSSSTCTLVASSVATVIVNAIPSAPTGSASQSYCGSATVSDLVASGTTIQWYDASSGGTLLSGPTALATATHYFASQTVLTCESTSRLDVTVTINSVPIAPTGTASQTFCAGALVSDILATGSGIKWYTLASGGSLLSGSIALTTATHYYASQTVSGCESTARLDVTVTLNSLPTITGTLSICAGATTTLNGSGTADPTTPWTSSLTGVATVDNSGLVAGVSGGTTNITYKDNNGCSKTVVFTVNAIPPAPTGSASQSFCGSATVADLVASGTAIQWYDASSGGTLLSGPTALATATHYFASQTVLTCESTSRLDVTVTINSVPIAPTGTASQTFCAGALVSDILATGSGIKWYTLASGGSLLSGSTALTTATHYYASQTVSGCESTVRLDVTVTVNALPLAPTGSAAQSFCAGATVADLAAAGTGIKWYTAASGGSLHLGTDVLTTSTHYFASQTVSGCESTDRLDVTVTVNALPTVTFTVQPGLSAICSETDVTYTTQSGQSSYIWGGFGTVDVDYSITSGGLSSTDHTVTLKWLTSGSKTVTMNYTNGSGCTATSPTSSLATPVNPAPGNPVFTAGSLAECYNSADETYTATSANSTSISYSVSPSGFGTGGAGTINSSTGVMSWKNTFFGTATITAIGSNTCGTSSTSEVVTVYPSTLATPVSITGSSTVCQGQSGVSYSIATVPYAADYVWTVPAGATFTGQGTTSIVVDFASASSGNITVHAHNSCVTGSDQTLAVAVRPNPTATISAPATVCQNSTSYVRFSTTTSQPITITYNIGGANQTTVNVASSSFTDVLIPTTSAVTLIYNLVSVVYQSGASCSASLSGTATTTVTPTVGTPTSITVSGGSEPTCQVTGSPTTTYSTTASDNTGFSWSLSTASAGSINASGVMTWTNGFAGNVDIRVKANGCNGPSSQVIRTVSVIGNPTTPIPSATTICQGSSNTTYTTTATSATTYTWSVTGSGNSISQGSSTGTVTWDPSFSGNSTIQVFADGCPSATASTSVAVRPTPAPGISGTASVCKNGTQPVITLTNNQNLIGTVTITYSINGVNQTPVDVATTVTMNAPTGSVGTFNYSLVSAVYKTAPTCSSIATGNAVVTVNPLPVPTISGPAIQRVTSTGNTYITESGMPSYTWSVSAGGAITSGAGTNSIAVTWNTTGSKTVSVNYTNTNNCTAPSPTVYNVQVNPLPTATGVSIPASADEGSLITGSYTYNDNGGYSEGTSTYKWYRGGSTVVATTKTYTPVSADVGYTLTFEVTPVSTSPSPNIGSPVQSSPTSAVISSGIPVASEVCIQGKRAESEILTGKYKYTYAFAESGTTFRWLLGADSLTATPISGATSIFYTLTSTDISGGQDIYFEVTPRCASPAKTGLPVKSTRLARITLSQDHYTDLVDTVRLTVIPTGGAFSGAGVTNGIFSPKSVGASVTPYAVKYSYTETNTTTTCSQQEIKNIYVSASTTQFSTVKDPICKDDAPFWVTVEAIPAGAIPYTYQYTDLISGSWGYDFGFFINDYYWNTTNTTNKGIITEELSNSPYNPSNPTPWKVLIDPSQLNVGTGVNILYLYYQDTYGYYYLIQIPLNVEEVATVNEISNLNSAYCSEDAKQQITVYGLYPPGGNATWTGTLITPSTTGDLISELDPSRGVPGNTYPITYRYTTLNGCKSNILSKDVAINPVPNANFTVAPYNNIEGGTIDLVPAVPPPTGTGATATFIGAGVSGSKFYPAIAGVGSFNIEYKVKTAENCTNSTTNTTEVDKPTGIFNGIPSKICYSNITYNVSMSGLPSDLAGYTVLNFTNKKNSLVWTPGSLTAQYNVADAHAGYDTLMFSYRRKGVDFTLSKGVFIDSIGNIQITGLKDNYCDYEGTATLRVLVENSTGSGNFSFSGPGIAFANYGLLADFYPSKTPTATPYTVSYTHVSTVNNTGCTKTETIPVVVNKSPSVSIFNTRITVNIKEAPLVLSGSPADGVFSGLGVYKSGSDYVFDPKVAGLGDREFTFSYTDTKGCSASKKDTLIVSAASGSILGINTNNQYCYDEQKDTLTYTSTQPWTAGLFSGTGITNTTTAKAVFDPSAAGKGDHEIMFTYSDLMGTVFSISSVVNVDSLGQVVIQNLSNGDLFCTNTAPFELFVTPKGGFFDGPVVSGSLDPSKGIGDTSLTYTYTNQRTGCFVTKSVPFTIFPAPKVSFVPADVCIKNSVDTIRFINNTTSSDPIQKWSWEFSDIGGTSGSNSKDPGYLFKTGGQHIVSLTATTTNGCSTRKDLTIDLGVKPTANFYWEKECYHPNRLNDSIMLFDTTYSPSDIVSRSWKIFGGQEFSTGKNSKYFKADTGYLRIQYIVSTKYSGCSDTITKDIYIRPTIALPADGYFQNFEAGKGGWVKGYDTPNSWSFGKPDKTVINTAASGNNAWFTGSILKSESSSIISPCFDFSTADRPMISLKLFRRFEKDRDGAVLQYEIGDSTSWTTVGTINDNINWYNSALIKGKPGGNQVGWTTTDTADTRWKEARHTLNELKGLKDVKFRIAYGSETSESDEGIAFDDIWIGERTRHILLEHFTNISNAMNSDAAAKVDSIAQHFNKDVINIQYHTNFPDTDPFYDDNPGDASARVLFYGLIKTPYSFIDGGSDKDNFAKIVDYNLSDIDSSDFTGRSLINPKFDIKLKTTVSGSILTISGTLTALEDINSDNLSLYLAVTEKKKEDKAHPGANGETTFLNVFRKFIPDAGGVILKKSWTKNEVYTLDDKTWLIEKIANSADIEVVAFVQNKVTKELYQAASEVQNDIVVGIENLLHGNALGFALYPNPAVNKVTVAFEEPLKTDADILIYDLQGIVIRSYKAGSGLSEFTIDDVSLRGGIYLVRVSAGGINYGFRKLIVSAEN